MTWCWLMVVELWHSVSQKLVPQTDMRSVYVMSQDTRSGHFQRIPLTGRPMDDTPITETTTDYQDTGWYTSHSAIALLCHWFFHASTLTPQGLHASWWQLPFNKVGHSDCKEIPIKWGPEGPSWANQALCRWYIRWVPISRTGLVPPSSTGPLRLSWWQVLLALLTWHRHMTFLPQDTASPLTGRPIDHTHTNHRDYHWLSGHWTGHNDGTWMWTRHATIGHESWWWPDDDRCYCCQLKTSHCQCSIQIWCQWMSMSQYTRLGQPLVRTTKALCYWCAQFLTT